MPNPDQPSYPVPPTSPNIDPAAVDWQRKTDLQHLKLLSIFYYIFGGLQAIGVCGGALYMAIGIVLANSPEVANRRDPNAPPPEFFGYFFGFMGGCIALLCIVWAALTIYAGLNLSKQRRRTYCMVAAGITCISVPLGTALGIFTFLVLSRPSVMALFSERQAEPGRV